MTSGQLHGSGYWCPNPKCKKKLDGFTSGGDATPTPGDFAVCCYCGRVLRFVENGVVNVTPEEWKSLSEARRVVLRKAAAVARAVFGEKP